MGDSTSRKDGERKMKILWGSFREISSTEEEPVSETTSATGSGLEDRKPAPAAEVPPVGPLQVPPLGKVLFFPLERFQKRG